MLCAGWTGPWGPWCFNAALRVDALYSLRSHKPYLCADEKTSLNLIFCFKSSDLDSSSAYSHSDYVLGSEHCENMRDFHAILWPNTSISRHRRSTEAAASASLMCCSHYPTV